MVKTASHKSGRKYKVYWGGDVWSLETNKIVSHIADGELIEYIFNNRFLKKDDLDHYLVNQDKLAKLVSDDRIANANLLKDALKAAGDEVNDKGESDMDVRMFLIDLMDKPLPVRLAYMSGIEPHHHRIQEYKNLADKTLADCFIKLFNYSNE